MPLCIVTISMQHLLSTRYGTLIPGIRVPDSGEVCEALSVAFHIYKKTVRYTTRSKSLWRMEFLNLRKSLTEMAMGRRGQQL